MIDVAKIDYWAASGSGAFHRASVAGKLIFVALVVAAAVLSGNVFALAAGYFLLVIVAAIARLPVQRIVAMSFYAAIFAALYSVSLRSPSVSVYGLVLFKAVTPAMGVLMLIVSTPYPRLFSLVGAALPEILSAGLFMTYRTFFILLDLMNSFMIALRLRAGLARGRIIKTVANLPRVIALLLVTAIERAMRLYAVMTVRGYNGSMAEKERGRLTKHDWLPIGAGAVILFLALIAK